MLHSAADELCDPAHTQQSFVEELIRLPRCFLCYTPATGHFHTHLSYTLPAFTAASLCLAPHFM